MTSSVLRVLSVPSVLSVPPVPLGGWNPPGGVKSASAGFHSPLRNGHRS